MAEPRLEFRTFLRTRWGVAFVAILGIAGLLLIFDHWSHIAGSDLALGGLLLACLAMHIFMHGSHSGHSGRGKGDD